LLYLTLYGAIAGGPSREPISLELIGVVFGFFAAPAVGFYLVRGYWHVQSGNSISSPQTFWLLSAIYNTIGLPAAIWVSATLFYEGVGWSVLAALVGCWNVFMVWLSVAFWRWHRAQGDRAV
jgi:hypothetical protein